MSDNVLETTDSTVPRTEEIMFQLSQWEKLLVISICLGLLALTIIITVCAVSPFCWLHNCLRKRKKGRQKWGSKRAEYLTPDKNGHFKLSPLVLMSDEKKDSIYSQLKPLKRADSSGTGSHQRLSLPDLPGLTNLVLKRNYTQDSTYSSMSTSSRGDASTIASGYSEASVDGVSVNGVTEMEMNYGQVTVGLRFKREAPQSVPNQLVITLKEAQDLPPRLYGGTRDPYLFVSVFPGAAASSNSSSGSRRKRAGSKGGSIPNGNSIFPIYEFRSTTKKRTQHPLFKESFVLEMTPSEVRDALFKLSAKDSEKLANDSELGQVVVAFKDLEIDEDEAEEQSFTFDFKEPKQENGELLFGLSFLPTAERLTFNIVKANNLASPFQDVEAFAPCVRVLLFRNGKLMKKKKTSTRPGTVTPSFNEALTFDVPPAELDKVLFLVVVSHREPQEVSSPESPGSPSEANSNTSPTGSSKRDKHIGQLVIGATNSNRCPGTTHHWNAMKQAPRKQVTQWHTLR